MRGDFKSAAISQKMIQFFAKGLYGSVITNVEKSINKSDQIPAEFGVIPNKQEGGWNLSPTDLLGFN